LNEEKKGHYVDFTDEELELIEDSMRYREAFYSLDEKLRAIFNSASKKIDTLRMTRSEESLSHDR
jgi:hypothetical protein